MKTFRLSSYSGWIKGFEPLASRATIWRANQLRYTHHIKLQTSLKGFEPPTHGLEGRCSIRLSYRLRLPPSVMRTTGRSAYGPPHTEVRKSR